MNVQKSLFANYEILVLKVARVVLVLLATVSFVMMVGALIWLAVSWIQPTANYKNVMVVPAYEPINSASNSIPSVDDHWLEADVKLPATYSDTLDSVDSLYQLVGRKEQKFSEKTDKQVFYRTLVEPFGDLDPPKKFATDFLIELLSYTDAMAKDELLKRIADVEERTTTIMSSMLQFRDEYVASLEEALTSTGTQSFTRESNTMVSTSVLLRVLSICALVFVITTISLLGFRVATQKEGVLPTKTT